MVFLSNKLNF